MKLIASFLLLLLMLGCKGPKAHHDSSDSKTEMQEITCIKQIIKEDSILGSIRNQSSEMISLSETISNYTNDLKALNFTQCPEKFKLAFDKHIEAWLAIQVITNKYPSTRGELHEIFADLEKSEDSTEFKSVVKQIWDTWNVVEKSAKLN